MTRPLIFREVQDHFDWRAQALLAGRYDDLALHYATPLLVDLHGNRFVLHSLDDVVLHLHRLRVALLDRGFIRFRPRVLALDLQPTDRRVWVEWRASGGPEQEDRTSQVEYRLDDGSRWLRVREMRYSSLIVQEFAAPSQYHRLKRSRPLPQGASGDRNRSAT